MDQLALNLEAPGFIPRAQAAPLLKFVGGKRWIVPILARGIHSAICATGGRYVEPFLGGAALASDLGLPNMLLTDWNDSLIEFYQCVVSDPDAVASALASIVARWGFAEPDYYAVRAWEPDLAVDRAARLLYLNKLGFNGVMRFNKAGKFNVPWGKRQIAPGSNPFYEEGALHRFSAAMKDSTIEHADFRECLAEVRKGDAVFVDSPYHGTFDAYVSSGFPEAAHAELAVTLEYLAVEVGAIVFMTNADTPEVREWYSWVASSPRGGIVPTAELHSVNRDGGGRGRKGCVLATNRMDLVGV